MTCDTPPRVTRGSGACHAVFVGFAQCQRGVGRVPRGVSRMSAGYRAGSAGYRAGSAGRRLTCFQLVAVAAFDTLNGVHARMFKASVTQLT